MQTPRSPSSSGSFSLIAAAAKRSTLKVPIRLTLTTLEKNSRLWGPPLCATRSAQPMPAQQTEIRSPSSCVAASLDGGGHRCLVGHVGVHEGRARP